LGKKRFAVQPKKSEVPRERSGLQGSRFLDSIKYLFSQKNGWRQNRRQP
jgi:hypothetical protein